MNRAFYEPKLYTCASFWMVQNCRNMDFMVQLDHKRPNRAINKSAVYSFFEYFRNVWIWVSRFILSIMIIVLMIRKTSFVVVDYGQLTSPHIPCCQMMNTTKRKMTSTQHTSETVGKSRDLPPLLWKKSFPRKGKAEMK